MRRFVKDFCDHSSVHGIRYFTERRRHWTERLFWILAIAVSIGWCTLNILNIWMAWSEKLVTISFMEKEQPISSIPFPMVSICPNTKFNAEKLNLTSIAHSFKNNVMLNLTDIELYRLEALSHVCPNDVSVLATELFQNEFVDESIYDVIKDIAPSFEQTFSECLLWNTYSCESMFKLVYTENHGLCFAFNALNAHEMYTDEMTPELKTIQGNPNASHWSLENGYQQDGLSKDTIFYPLRMFNTQFDGALSLTLGLWVKNIEYLCGGIIQGFKVILNAPGETAKSSERYYQLVRSEKVEILIKPKIVTTSEKLRNYTPNQRQCFFNADRQLRFYQIYTQNNCESECLANFTSVECGCVKYSMPRDRATRICGSNSIGCYVRAKNELFGRDFIDDVANDTVKLFRQQCNCLPACTAIKYAAEIDRTKFDYDEVVDALGTLLDKNFTKNHDEVEYMALYVSFADPNVVTLQRSVLYTYSEFLSICGGLLGLFLGISVLSIIEVLYYLTLRLYWNIRRSRIETDVVLFERRDNSSNTIVSNPESSLANRQKETKPPMKRNKIYPFTN